MNLSTRATVLFVVVSAVLITVMGTAQAATLGAVLGTPPLTPPSVIPVTRPATSPKTSSWTRPDALTSKRTDTPFGNLVARAGPLACVGTSRASRPRPVRPAVTVATAAMRFFTVGAPSGSGALARIAEKIVVTDCGRPGATITVTPGR